MLTCSDSGEKSGKRCANRDGIDRPCDRCEFALLRCGLGVAGDFTNCTLLRRAPIRGDIVRGDAMGNGHLGLSLLDRVSFVRITLHDPRANSIRMRFHSEFLTNASLAAHALYRAKLFAENFTALTIC